MIIIGIDPGPTESAYCFLHYAANPMKVMATSKVRNPELLSMLRAYDNWDYNIKIRDPHIAIEMVASYGMPVGKEVFETCLWIGRFVEAWEQVEANDYELIYRKTICAELCGSAKAKDANIRQAIIDLFPATGGGKVPQIGTKANPGPLYGVSGDCWSAIAVAIVAARQVKEVAA